jgi:hypothetical protein
MGRAEVGPLGSGTCGRRQELLPWRLLPSALSAIILRMPAAYHRPPRGDLIPRALSASAMPARDWIPVARMASMTGMRLAAVWHALRHLAARGAEVQSRLAISSFRA